MARASAAPSCGSVPAPSSSKMTSERAIDLLEDADDIRDVTAERAERLLDGLLIADIGIDRVEARQLRAALRRDMQSALRHQGEQPNRFQRNGFPARVRTGDDNGARAWLRINIDGHNSVWDRAADGGLA